jgi:hypothetical protein
LYRTRVAHGLPFPSQWLDEQSSGFASMVAAALPGTPQCSSRCTNDATEAGPASTTTRPNLSSDEALS